MLRSDIVIALSFEIPPFLQVGESATAARLGQAAAAGPFRIAHNTPLVSSLVPFARCADALGMHPATASVLDDMRFLIATVVSLPPSPSPVELQKLHAVAVWVHDRTAKLPETAPASSSSSSSSW